LDAFRPVKPVLCDVLLQEIIDQCLRTQKEELKQLRIRITREISKDPLTILGDGGQLQQAFLNVLRNAMDALDAGGTIRIRLTSDGIFAVLEVRDNGTGISSDAFSQLFQPKFSTKTLGNGLGLLVVQRILGVHGGSLCLRSLRPRGTAAILRFPLKNPQFPGLGCARFAALPS
jgi:signal transduction histidine kinase